MGGKGGKWSIPVLHRAKDAHEIEATYIAKRGDKEKLIFMHMKEK
jgi:hypothetical protein